MARKPNKNHYAKACNYTQCNLLACKITQILHVLSTNFTCALHAFYTHGDAAISPAGTV